MSIGEFEFNFGEFERKSCKVPTWIAADGDTRNTLFATAPIGTITLALKILQRWRACMHKSRNLW